MSKSFVTRVFVKPEVEEQPAIVEHIIPVTEQAVMMEGTTQVQQQTDVVMSQSATLNVITNAIQQVQLVNYIPMFFDNNIYLFNYADKARWASGQLVDADNSINNSDLPWMGGEGDSRGFVRLNDGVIMEDGKTYRALRTHPKWVNNGTIKGWLPWVKQNGSGTFRAQVGFLNGAIGTDGVIFQVWVHYLVDGREHWENVITQPKSYNGQLQEISADLSRWAFQEISIELRVDAGPSSGRDWAAWINPWIEVVPVIQIPGPIISNGNPVFFDDRYDVNKKWYWPDFRLKQPLKDNFMFSCFKNTEPGEDGNRTYNGEVNFTLIKSDPPSAIASLTANNAGLTYTEIPLNNLCINFILAFKDKQPVTYIGTVTLAGNEYTLSLKSITKQTPQDQETFLLILFNFLSNSNNAAYCTLSVTGSFFGYTPKPGANDYTSDASLLFTKIFNNVNFPCAGIDGYANNYFIKDDIAPPVPFGCHPPFGVPAANNNTYTLYTPVDVTEYGINAIYRNEYNFNYLIIPQKYTIMLERASHSSMEDQLVPAAYLTTVIDDSNTANCTAAFQFHIAPEISAYQLWAIKKLIFEKTKTPVSNNSIDDIHIEFPEAIYQPETIVFDNVSKTQITGLGANEYGVRGSRYFQLEFQDVSIGDGSAGLIADIIKGQMSGTSMVSAISFDVDSSNAPHPKSAVELSLNKISGIGLSLQKNEADNKIYFLNRTFYDISVSAITSDTETSINPALTVSKNNSVEAPVPVTADNFLSAIPRYSYSLNQDYNNSVLAEMRIDVQNVSDIIIVTNNTGLFRMYNIAEIGITISILLEGQAAGEVDFSKALLTVSKSITEDGIINYVPFVLPVGTYSSKWSAVYTTNIIFTAESGKEPQPNKPQVIKNLNSIGKVINLTVSNLSLHKL